MRKHFNQEHWSIFQTRMYPETVLRQMEDHLTECDQCREGFLSLINEEEVQEAEKILSADFADRVMVDIGREKNLLFKKKKFFHQAGTNNAIYFATAAAITLILMGGGFFQSLVDSMPQIAATPVKMEQSPIGRIKMGWSEQVVDRASNWIENFEAQDRGGVEFGKKK